MAEPSPPNTFAITVAMIVITLFLFVVTIGLIHYFEIVQQRIFRAKVEQAPTMDLQNLRAQEDELLNGYAHLDRDKKLVRIPIQRAMQLEAIRPWHVDVLTTTTR